MLLARKKGLFESTRVLFLPIAAISPNPNQPRKTFAQDGLEELAASIRLYGVLQPLSVRKIDTGYELISGERRLRASQLAGLTEVPCILVHVDDEASSLLALIENLQRRDLDFVEEAAALARLIRTFHLSQEEAARKIGKSQSAVANKLRLLRHSQPVLEALREAELTERHGRALLRLESEEEKLAAIAQIARQHMSVARTESYIDALLASKPDQPQRPNVGAFLNTLTQNLQKIQRSGIPAISERRETDQQIVLTITIPKL